ncbi:hypothetical protein PR048_007671 [Dryococelus australis]|uniref:Uncharacterized protein n=1 Tax=Dryococelus australis TaxID=614101 RepID=A0ABQ9HUX7_9NEOP|nr:hypothetical protein PR048_007671 [Dryococelus australis]
MFLFSVSGTILVKQTWRGVGSLFGLPVMYALFNRLEDRAYPLRPARECTGCSSFNIFLIALLIRQRTATNEQANALPRRIIFISEKGGKRSSLANAWKAKYNWARARGGAPAVYAIPHSSAANSSHRGNWRPIVDGTRRMRGGHKKTARGRAPRKETLPRYNDVCKIIVREWIEQKKGATVVDEPTLEIAGENFKPDLVLANEKEVFLAEITIRYEKEDSSVKAAQDEVDKCNASEEKIGQMYDDNIYRGVVPVILWVRRTVPVEAMKELRRLGLDFCGLLSYCGFPTRLSHTAINCQLKYTSNTRRLRDGERVAGFWRKQTLELSYGGFPTRFSHTAINCQLKYTSNTRRLRDGKRVAGFWRKQTLELSYCGFPTRFSHTAINCQLKYTSNTRRLRDGKRVAGFWRKQTLELSYGGFPTRLSHTAINCQLKYTSNTRRLRDVSLQGRNSTEVCVFFGNTQTPAFHACLEISCTSGDPLHCTAGGVVYTMAVRHFIQQTNKSAHFIVSGLLICSRRTNTVWFNGTFLWVPCGWSEVELQASRTPRIWSRDPRISRAENRPERPAVVLSLAGRFFPPPSFVTTRTNHPLDSFKDTPSGMHPRVGGPRPSSRNSGATRATLPRTPGASSPLRARRAVFPS